MSKFTRNVHAIWDEYNIGHHLGFAFLCFCSILLIPFWLYAVVSWIFDWFNNADLRRQNEIKERIQQNRTHDYLCKQILDRLEHEGISGKIDDRIKDSYHGARIIEKLIKAKKVNNSFLEAYKYNPIDLIINWETHITPM